VTNGIGDFAAMFLRATVDRFQNLPCHLSLFAKDTNVFEGEWFIQFSTGGDAPWHTAPRVCSA
jgi:hypothetical protein